MGTGTGANVINIGSGATLTGITNTIHIGDGTPAGTGLTNITIGNALNTGALTLKSGSGNITIGSNAGNGTVVISPNAGGQAALIINKQADLGMVNPNLFVASSAGILKFAVDSGGNATASGGLTVGGLVGLSTSSSGSDPIGFAGAMYYNSSLTHFRCFTSSWVSCDSTAATQITFNNVIAATADQSIDNGTNQLVWSNTGKTTGIGLTINGDATMTTGGLLSLSSSTYVHTVNSGEAGSVARINFTDHSSDNNAVTTTTNGLVILTTVDTTGSGTKSINAINTSAPSITGCGTGNCVIDGLLTHSLDMGNAVTIKSNWIDIQATKITLGNLNGINISNVAAGGSNQNAIQIGTGWNKDIFFITSTTGSTHAFTVQDQATAATAGDALSFTAGLGNTTGNGGAITVTSGGSGSGATGNGGALTFAAGAANSTNGTGGLISITSGVGTGTGASGAVTLQSGTVGASGTSGAVTLDIGTGGTAGAINIGTSAIAKTITIGETGTTTQTIRIGQGAAGAADVITIANVQNGGSVSIGGGMTTGTFTVGAGAMTGAIAIGNGNGATQTIGIGNTASTTVGGKTITIGNNGAQTSGNADTINIGTQTGTVAQVVNIGTGSINTQVNFRDLTAAPGAEFSADGQFGLGTNGNSTSANAGRMYIHVGSTARNFRFNSVANSADYSEYLQQSDTSEPGDVMVLSKTNYESVHRSVQPYDQQVLGVVTKYGTSNNAGDCWDEASCDRGSSPQWANVGMLGQVYTKVSTENGNIQPGDPITTSNLTGVGMKALKAGRIVGYAIDYFDGTKSGNDLWELGASGVSSATLANGQIVKIGKILILLQASWYDPSAPPPGTTAGLQITNNGSPGTFGSYGITDGNGRSWDNTIVAQNGAIANLKVGGLAIDTIAANSISTGILTADTIKANHIEGLEVLTNQLSTLNGTVTTLSQVISGISTQSAVLGSLITATGSAMQNTQQLSGQVTIDSLAVTGLATVSADLRVQGNGFVEGILSVIDTIMTKNLIVNSISDFFGNVVFHSERPFQGRQTFNSNTAGFALIKQGA